MANVDPYVASVPVLERHFRRQTADRKAELMRRCSEQLSGSGWREERDRVALVKTLIALLPDSAPIVRRWIESKSSVQAREIQFSLFCFLDAVERLDGASKFRKEIPKLLERYLMKAKSSGNHATWMAGDLLGDHWDAHESLPILLKVAHKGKFAAGRAAAVVGLQRLRDRRDVTRATKDVIDTALTKIGELDRSRKIRAWTTSLLTGFERG